MTKQFNQYNNRGFTILETFLAVMVIFMAFTVIFEIFEDYADKKQAQSMANYTETIAQAIDNIIGNPEYYSRLYNDANAEPNDILEITLDDLANGSGALMGIPPSDIITDQFQNLTPYKTGINIMVRVADDPSITTDSAALEIIIATDALAPTRKALLAGSHLKSNGGYFDNPDENIKSAYATWEIPLTNLADTTWFATSDATPPTLDESYFFYYKYITLDEIAGDYLYRINVAGQEELNTLYGSLNLGNNNILGADNLTANNLTAAESVVSNGNMNINQSATINAGNMTAGQVVNATDVTIRGLGGGSTGNFITEGATRIGNYNIRNNLRSDNAEFNSSVTTTSNLNIGNMETININVGELNTTNFNAGNSGANNVIINNRLNAQTVASDSITVNGGLTSIDATISDDYQINGDVTSRNVIIDNTLNVSNFGECDLGC